MRVMYGSVAKLTQFGDSMGNKKPGGQPGCGLLTSEDARAGGPQQSAAHFHGQINDHDYAPDYCGEGCPNTQLPPREDHKTISVHTLFPLELTAHGPMERGCNR